MKCYGFQDKLFHANIKLWCRPYNSSIHFYEFVLLIAKPKNSSATVKNAKNQAILQKSENKKKKNNVYN